MPILRAQSRIQKRPFRPPGRRAKSGRHSAPGIASVLHSSKRGHGDGTAGGPAAANARPTARSSRPSSTSGFPPSGSTRTSWRSTDSPASYDSVKRFVRQLGSSRAVAVSPDGVRAGRRSPGRFRHRRRVVAPDGKRRKTHVFRIVLSHSRKAYSEATFTQTTEDFIGCLENAFRAFGGVPKTLVIDNLKAAVEHPDWFDPELTPKLQSFCRHYGTVILPTKPYMPRHKGKVESGVKYVQDNAPEGREVPQPRGAEQLSGRLGSDASPTRGSTAPPSGRWARSFAKRAPCAAAVAAGAVPLLPRSAAEGQPRRARRGGQGVLLRAAGVPGTHGLGPLGRAAGADLQPPLRADRPARAARAGPLQHARRALAPEKINGIERGAAYLLDKVRVDRPAVARNGPKRCSTPAASKARGCCKGC